MGIKGIKWNVKDNSKKAEEMTKRYSESSKEEQKKINKEYCDLLIIDALGLRG